MEGIKVVFEFSLDSALVKEDLKRSLQQQCEEKGINIANLWCFLEKDVIMNDFPISYTTNECIAELVMSEGDSSVCLFNKFKEIVTELEAKEIGFEVSKIAYKVIKICKDKEALYDNKRVFVTGMTGQLGHDVMNRLYELGYEPVGSGYSEDYFGVQDGTPVTMLPYISLNITEEMNVKKVIEEINPSVVIHCAAWNGVDLAEEKNRAGWVRATNAKGTRYIAETCKQIGAKMVYISTDYVFDGEGQIPWEAETKEYHALNVYGQTKLEGEFAVSEVLDRYFIVRTSWAYGINGNNFVKAMLNVAKKSDTVRVVDDQIGTPTYMKDLAELIVNMISTEKYGYYHATNEGGYISWYEFACEIFRQAGLPTKVLPVSTEVYGNNKATRPSNSRLDKSKLVLNGFHLLPDWKDALGRYLAELDAYSSIKKVD